MLLLSSYFILCDYDHAMFDVLRNMGYSNQVLPGNIRPIDLKHKIAGRVFTLEGQIAKTIDTSDKKPQPNIYRIKYIFP